MFFYYEVQKAKEFEYREHVRAAAATAMVKRTQDKRQARSFRRRADLRHLFGRTEMHGARPDLTRQVHST